VSLITSILAFLLLLSFLILIHECGHFFAARKSKVIVEEFGFGLPPRAKKLFTQGGTIFSLNWIPFGGFVRLKGENASYIKGKTLDVGAGEMDRYGKFFKNVKIVRMDVNHRDTVDLVE
jgi:membrane-associated protease RseP (regulator of RpoE activity)